MDNVNLSKEVLQQLVDQWNTNSRNVAGEVTFAGFNKLKPFKYGKELTNSARSTFMNCQKKYEYSYIYGLAPRKTNIPFLVGGLFHDELEHMYKDKKLNIKAMEKRVSKACEKACKYPGVLADDSEKIWMQQAIVTGMVKGYAAMYLKGDLTKYRVVETEGEFKTNINKEWVYRGKKDLVVSSIKTKKLYLVEHKTTAMITAGYVGKLPMDNQILGYAWTQKKSGKKFDGIIYNVTKKPGIKQRQTESLQQFYKRVEEEYMLNPGAYFYRETINFTDKDLLRFEEELKRFVGYIERAYSENYFMQNAGHCNSMGICPFMQLCLNGVSKETLMNYRIKEKAHEELPDNE